MPPCRDPDGAADDGEGAETVSFAAARDRRMERWDPGGFGHGHGDRSRVWDADRGGRRCRHGRVRRADLLLLLAGLSTTFLWQIRSSTEREVRPVADADHLTEEEVAVRAGMTPERLRGLVDLGLLEPDDGGFLRRDVMRARMVAELESKGLDLQALASAHASGHLTLGYLESAGRRHPRTDRTFAEFSEQVGLPIDTLQTCYVAFGLPRPRAEDYVRKEDEPILKALPVLFGAGVGEGDVLRALRIWGDSARRVAQFQVHYFHNTIEEPFRRRRFARQRGSRGCVQRGRPPDGTFQRRHAGVALPAPR